MFSGWAPGLHKTMPNKHIDVVKFIKFDMFDVKMAPDVGFNSLCRSTFFALDGKVLNHHTNATIAATNLTVASALAILLPINYLYGICVNVMLNLVAHLTLNCVLILCAL